MNNPFEKEKRKKLTGYCIRHLEGKLILFFKEREIEIPNFLLTPYKPRNKEETEFLDKNKEVVKYEDITKEDVIDMIDKAMFNVKNKKNIILNAPK